MLLQIDHLCKELDIAKKSSQKDRNEKCIAYCSCQPRKCDSDSDLASQKTKDLVKKIFDGHVITDQEINDLSENELQDVISEMLNDRGENEESKIVEQDFNLILNNADNFMSASDEHFKNISPKESNETIGESPESPKDATFSPEFPKTPYQSLETFDTVLQTVIQNLAKVVEENKSIFGEQTKEGEKEVEDEESEADIEKPCSLDCISSSNEILKHSLDSDEQFKETEIIKVNLNSLGEELLNFYKEDISTEDDIIEENCAKSKEKPEIIDDENKKEEKIECSDANCAEINDPKLQPSNNFKNEVHFDEEFEQNFENVVAKDQSTTSEPDLSLVEQSSENERKEAVQLLLEYPRKLDESETTEKSSDTLEPLKTNSSTGKTDIVDELLLISESSLPEVNVVEEPYSESINEEENKEKDQIISSITKFILNKTFKTIESTGNALKTIESNGNELKTIPLKQKANTCPIDCEIQPKNDSDFVSKIEEVLFNNYKELYDCTKAQCAEKNTYKLCETNKCLANRDCKPKIPMSKYLDKYKTHCTRIIYREGARPCDEISDGEISRNSSDLSKKICVKIYKKSQPSILAHLKKYEQGTERCKINVATQCYCTSDRQLFCCCDRNKASCRRIYPAVGTQTSNSSFNITDSFRDSLLSDGEVQNTSSESSARTETSDYDSFKRRL